MNMEQPGHSYSFRTLIATYFGLLFLAALMVGTSRIDVSLWGACKDTNNFLCALAHLFDMHTVRTAVILGIALTMGVITALILMGLAFEKRLINAIIFLANFPFLAIFVTFTWADHAFRGETDKAFTEQINWQSPVLLENAKEALADSIAHSKGVTTPEGEHTSP
jgi:hypothetical protein